MSRIVQLLDFLIPYGVHSYFVMFGLLLACGFGLPLPEDVILITGGILASRGVTGYWTTVAVTLTGVLIGDGAIFFMGRMAGPRIKSSFLFRHILTEHRNEKVRLDLQKYGHNVIFLARFMPGLRMPIYLTTGMYHVPAWKFFLLDGLAALISVPLWIHLGYLFGSNLEELERRIDHFRLGFYIVLAVVLAGTIGLFLYRKARKEKASLS